MAGRKSKKQLKKLIALVVAIIAAFAVYQAKDLTTTTVTNDEFISEDSIFVHFIDVGQGSATLIQQGRNGVIIDAGEKDYGEAVTDYIRSVGVETLVLAGASHPHSDHIGGLDEVISAFPTEEIILPYLTESNTPTTRAYEDLLIAIDENDINAVFVEHGEYSKKLTKDASLKVVGPLQQSDNLNDMSLVCMVECFGTTFMLPGDAEEDELRNLIRGGSEDYKSDVIAMPHHGSATSVYQQFLYAVDADVAVISCGKDNSYGHPHKQALDFINENAMTCLRTDEMGDIVFKVTPEGYSLVE